MIPTIRTLSQQLVNPKFTKPQDLVSWMGAIQAQDYNMCKWAVGARLASATITDVENALAKGEILRTHVMRPTWHLVTAEDIRWMLELCRKRIKAVCASRDKQLGIDEKLFYKTNNLIVKMLEGNNHLTRQEIAERLIKAGIATDTSRMVHFMYRAEAEGIVCSGVDKEKKQTYALIDERVKQAAKTLQKDEALALLANKYFQSHSPASIQDFTWWSGLSIFDSKYAINLISSNLCKERFGDIIFYIHKLYNEATKFLDSACLLPSFDEYLISYKDRTAVIDAQHQPKAFTNNGIFRPIVMYNGKIIGTWRKVVKKEMISIEISAFENKKEQKKEVLKKIESKYLLFHSFSKT